MPAAFPAYTGPKTPDGDRTASPALAEILELTGLEHVTRRLARMAERHGRLLRTPWAATRVVSAATAKQVGAALAHLGQPTARIATPDGRLMLAGGVALEVDDPATDWPARARSIVCDQRTTELGGPVLLHGTAFEPTRPRDPVWEPFGGARAWVPRVLVRSRGAEHLVTVAGPGDEAPRDEVPARLCMSNGGREDRLFVERVAAALRAIERGEVSKLVVSRTLDLPAPRWRLDTLAERLDALYPTTCRWTITMGATTFVGATPELLCSVRGRVVRSMALAGTGPAQTPSAALLADAKLRREHQAVVADVRDGLSKIGEPLAGASVPEIMLVRGVAHLHTPVTVRCSSQANALDIARVLHPTSAICGTPRTAAHALIHRLEHHDRGWYTGRFGWTDARGDGDQWVALRCATLTPAGARLYAGVGVVAGSDPELELEESHLKLAAMREVLCPDGAVG